MPGSSRGCKAERAGLGGATAMHLALEAIEVHGVRKYLEVCHVPRPEPRNPCRQPAQSPPSRHTFPAARAITGPTRMPTTQVSKKRRRSQGSIIVTGRTGRGLFG